MPCYSPIAAWQTEGGDVVFVERGRIRRALTLPCGQCIGCRLERSRQWAVRCMHEAALHEKNAFITLTYDPENLPLYGSLVYRDFQLFMKRLRKHAPGVRFFMCGEYGELYQRPHYHACLFGYQFPDLKYYSRGASGSDNYTSELLSRLWTVGFATVGQLTFESAAYVARYVCKKVTGSAADAHYCRTDLRTGEIVQVEPEFGHMSLKPGIGAKWLDKYYSEVYPFDRVIVRGHPAKPPRFYDKRLETLDYEKFEELDLTRYTKSVSSAEDCTPERLRVREAVTRARLKFKVRSLE